MPSSTLRPTAIPCRGLERADAQSAFLSGAQLRRSPRSDANHAYRCGHERSRCKSRSAAEDVKSLVELARQKPGTLTYASQGIGSNGHITGELFTQRAQIEILHVPYKGSAPAVQDCSPAMSRSCSTICLRCFRLFGPASSARWRSRQPGALPNCPKSQRSQKPLCRALIPARGSHFWRRKLRRPRSFRTSSALRWPYLPHRKHKTA